jgi:UDP-N-acetylglucosamine transferase subunit ALG13
MDGGPLREARAVRIAGEEASGRFSVAPARSNDSRLRVCLAASGGGHFRQLLDLEPVWSRHEHFFVTEDSPLTRSIAEKHRVHFIAHFALGQIRRGAPIRMTIGAARNFVGSALLMMRHRPDVVVTTGAAAAFFSVLWAKLLGAKVVLVETFARFDGPSVFGRFAVRLADLKVVQSEGLRRAWPDAVVFNPLKLAQGPIPEKQPLLFATVGAVLPFDRLVRMIADLRAEGGITERVIAQVGASGLAVEGLETYESLSFDEMQSHLRDADLVVCHAGTGSLITALQAGCRVVAVPRERDRKEVNDNHQFEIAESFAVRGLIEVAHDKGELAAALRRARARPRLKVAFDHSDLSEFLNRKLDEWSAARPRKRQRGVLPRR